MGIGGSKLDQRGFQWWDSKFSSRIGFFSSPFPKRKEPCGYAVAHPCIVGTVLLLAVLSQWFYFFLFSYWFSKCFCGTTVPPRSFLVSPAYSQRLQWFPCRNWFGGPPRCMKSCALWAYVGHDLEDMTAHQETSPAHRLLIESLFFWSEDCCVEEAVSSATWPRGTLALSRGILLSIRSPGEADGCLPPLSEHRIWRAKSCSAETNASSGIRCALLCMVLYKGRLTHNRLYQRAVPPHWDLRRRC